MFAAFDARNYRLYFAGSFVSNVGTWMQRVAQDWLVLELSGGSAMAVGITTGLQFLPMLLLTAYGGLLADRLDKRLLLRVTQGWMALCAGALGVLAITGIAETWHVYLLAFCFGVGAALDVPARQSFVAEVAGAERLPNAIGLNSAAFHSARIVGPALSGFLIAALGSGWAILANAVSYLAFLLALGLLDCGQLEPAPRAPRARRQLRAGIAYVRQRRDLVLILWGAFFVGTFGMNFQMTSALMAQQEFHRGAQQYGLLGTFVAVGSLTGALLAARRRSAPGVRWVLAAAFAVAGTLLLAGMMPSYWAYAAVLPLLGLATLTTLTAANATVQAGVEPGLRGRVMALYVTVLMGGTPLGAPLLGWIGAEFGPRWTLIGGGLGVAIGLSVVIGTLRIADLRRRGGPAERAEDLR